MKQKLSFWGGVIFLLLVIAFVFSLGVMTWEKVTDARLLPISKLEMQGQVNYTKAQDIQQAIFSISPLGSVITQNVNQLQSVIQNLPWVESVAVRKQWPDTLKLFIVEHKAVAIWNKDKLLNTDGTVFNGNINDVLDQHLIMLFASDDHSVFVMKTWQKIKPLFEAQNLSLKEVWYSTRHAWTLILSNGIRLELGKEALIERIKRFLLVYPKIQEKQLDIDYVDLRYDTGLAVGWKNQ